MDEDDDDDLIDPVVVAQATRAMRQFAHRQRKSLLQLHRAVFGADRPHDVFADATFAVIAVQAVQDALVEFFDRETIERALEMYKAGNG